MARQSFELNILAERAFSATLLAKSDGRLDPPRQHPGPVTDGLLAPPVARFRIGPGPD